MNTTNQTQESEISDEQYEKQATLSVWRSCHGFSERHKKNFGECSKHPQWLAAAERLKRVIGTGAVVCLLGRRGTGKTQLAYHGVAHYIVGLKRPWMDKIYSRPYQKAYVTAMQFFMKIKATYGNSKDSAEAVITEFVNCPILVIDEIQVRGETDWENQMLTYMMDRRYSSKKDTILISNQKRDAFIESIGPSIADRIRETGGIIEMDWDSFRAE